MTAAICENCGEQYGNKNLNNHANEELAYRQDPNVPLSHVKLHACCETEIGIEAHTGASSANCYHGDICDICGIEYSDKIGYVYDDGMDTQCNVCGHGVVAEEVEPIKITDDSDKGCQSSIALTTSAIAVTAVVLGIVFLKKKDN